MMSPDQMPALPGSILLMDRLTNGALRLLQAHALRDVQRYADLKRRSNRADASLVLNPLGVNILLPSRRDRNGCPTLPPDGE